MNGIDWNPESFGPQIGIEARRASEGVCVNERRKPTPSLTRKRVPRRASMPDPDSLYE